MKSVEAKIIHQAFLQYTNKYMTSLQSCPVSDLHCSEQLQGPVLPVFVFLHERCHHLSCREARPLHADPSFHCVVLCWLCGCRWTPWRRWWSCVGSWLLCCRSWALLLGSPGGPRGPGCSCISSASVNSASVSVETVARLSASCCNSYQAVSQ